ncbi:hypothetical protein [Saccharomonospora piscinae]|uniref:hypothetical protein n=1 Tax=Saccharomonospora piscinae TaxID=687388 RepID=UPI00046482F2|nr:hypothetical protein [Saccharomonospora piscinae]
MTRLRAALTATVLTASALAGGLGVASAAPERPGGADGSLTAAGETCRFGGARTSGRPPSALTLDAASVNRTIRCSGGARVRLDRSPRFLFHDGSGRATVRNVRVSVTAMGVTCTYATPRLTAGRQGGSRTYVARGVRVANVGGGFLCPGSATADVRFSFR